MTQRQRILFFRTFAQACERQGIPPAEREAYRHRLIAETVPMSRGSLKCVGSGTDFDRLMRTVAQAAQSFETSAHFAVAEARRLAKMCEALVWQIWAIECGMPEALRGKSTSTAITPADYLRGVIAQAGWRWAVVAADDGWWLDLPLPHAQKLMMMLDTHRRRLLKRAPFRRERLPDGSERRMRLAFDVDCAYRWDGDTLWKEPVTAAPAPRVRIRIAEPA